MSDGSQPTKPPSHDLEIDPLEDIEDAARGVVQTIRRVSSRVLVFSLLSYLVATAVGITTVFMHNVRDQYLFIAMYLVLFVYILAYIKAHQLGARVRSIASLTIAELLMGFWVYILIDRIPQRTVFISSGDAVSSGEIIQREPMTLLWVTVVALTLTALGLLAHWLWNGRLARNLT